MEIEVLQNKIFEIRGYKVMLDFVWHYFTTLKQRFLSNLFEEI